MENKNLLLKGRTSIYFSIVIGCFGMSTLFYFVSNLVWSVLGFLPNIYFHIFQIIASLIMIYLFLMTIYSYEIYEDCIIKKYYTKIKHNYIRYDNIKITKVHIGGFKQIELVIYFTFQDKDYVEGTSIDGKKQLGKLIEYCHKNHIPYDDTPIFGGRYD